MPQILGGTTLASRRSQTVQDERVAWRSGVVDVRHIAGTENPADMFTKVLPPQTFHKHRKFVMNLHGEEGVVAPLARGSSGGPAADGDAGDEGAP